MEFIFELIAEIIMEPIVEGYILAMSHFSDGSKKLDEDKVKTIVILESVALFLMFVVGGGIMLDKSNGESVTGKILLISSVAVSVVQILFGVILNRLKKKRIYDGKMKISVSHYKNSDKELFRNGGTLHIDNDEIVLKNLLKKVVVFKIGYVKYRVLPDELFFKAVELFDDEKSYIFLFYRRNCLKILKVLSDIDKELC